MKNNIYKFSGIAALFAASVFTSCEKQPTPGPDNGGEPNGKGSKIERSYSYLNVYASSPNGTNVNFAEFVPSNSNKAVVFSNFSSGKSTVEFIGVDHCFSVTPIGEGTGSTGYRPNKNAIFRTVVDGRDTVIWYPEQKADTVSAEIVFGELYGDHNEKFDVAQERITNMKSYKYDYRPQ